MSESSDRIPAFAYLRVSGKGQLDGDGFPRQRESIERYAAANGYEIARWFEEKAVCGATEWDDRPAWMEMAQSFNGTRIVIFESLNRLARDLMVQEHIIKDLRERKITPISVAEPDLCVDDPTRKLLRQIMGAIAEYDRAMIVLKLRASRNRAKAVTGRCEGRKPYGHHPVESSVVEQMQAMRSTGYTCEQIADALNSGGIYTRYGKQWQFSGVAKILRRAK